MLANVNKYWKTIVSAVGILVIVGNQVVPFLPPHWQDVFSSIVGLLTVIGVYQKTNTTTDPVVAANESVKLKAANPT